MTGNPQCVKGQELPARTVQIQQADIIRFAGACGDFNPLHFDSDLAGRAGFPAPIAMGQMTSGILATWIADWCGIERMREVQVRFVAPVFAGDTVTLSGSVVEVEHGGTDTLVRVDVAVDSRGHSVLSGAAIIVVPNGSED